ncbi:PREDICTED: uncharacterized protein C17orf47 homolog [Myotis davidii]|uniref:uncharacterized protein C17orf47 homolog n=1 Tax=Myotis davidii TaxID=225400 RepID=UPI000767AF54|nr:PREDICTED: uncharacterized protein C17orf47 homolog [Myotis davidii]
MVKTNKTGTKVIVSTQKGAEITSTTPHQGRGSIAASTHRSAVITMSPPIHRRSEPGHTVIPRDDHRFSLPGSSFTGAPISRGTESRSKSDAYHHSSLHRKIQQTQPSSSYAVHVQRASSPHKEESPRKRAESKGGHDMNRYSTTNVKSSRRLSFVDQKDNIQTLPEDPPSKVQNPQGVRVPRRPLICPKDEAVQTEPTRKSITVIEKRSPRKASSPERSSSRPFADPRTAQRRTPDQESETSPYSPIYIEPKPLHRNKNVEPSLRLSILKDLDGGHRVSMREPIHKQSAYTETKPSPKVLMSSEVEANMKSPMRGDNEVSRRVTIYSGVQPAQPAHHVTARTVSESPPKPPEPVSKQRTPKPSENVYTSPEPSPSHSAHAKMELTPRPLPPRSLPKYGPDCSWWPLLNPDIEMPQSRPTTPDLEPKSPLPADYSLSFFEMDSSPFCDDVLLQREKASPSPPPEPPSWAPLREVPQAPKHTSKQPIQRFSAFFLDVSEEMFNRVIWWLKGLCFSLP